MVAVVGSNRAICEAAIPVKASKNPEWGNSVRLRCFATVSGNFVTFAPI